MNVAPVYAYGLPATASPGARDSEVVVAPKQLAAKGPKLLGHGRPKHESAVDRRDGQRQALARVAAELGARLRALVGEGGVEALQAGVQQRLVVDQSREPGAGRHAVKQLTARENRNPEAGVRVWG